MNATYTTQDLSVLVEEYLTQQCSQFTLCGLYAYIVFWGMEDKRIAIDQLSDADKENVNGILERVVKDGRIKLNGEEYVKVIN